MENIMTSHHPRSRAHRVGRTLGLGLAVGLALIANLGDRAFSASAANSGIDPLQILDTAVKNNVLFFVDTSGSMVGTPENQNFQVGGDDPASRFYQMKRAVREVVGQNVGKANFGLATFDPNPAESQINATDALIYVTQDPTGSGWDGYFNKYSTTFANVNADSCVGATCTTTESSKIFRGIGGGGSYPAGCTNQPSGNQVASSGVANPPITHVFGTHCRYYMNSMLMRNGKRYLVKTGLSNSGTTRQDGAIVSSTNIVCPLPPPGLLGDDVLAYADGTKARACYQLQDGGTNGSNGTNAITTYWMTASHFEYVNATPGLDSCSSNGTVLSVSSCDVDNSAALQANMRMELQYNANGDAQFLPPVTSVQNGRPGITDTPAFKNVGIRLALFTPLAAAMQFSLNYFRTTVLPAAGTPQRPVAAQGKQKNFVILLTDGDETCGGNPEQAAYNLWSNTLPALPACTGSCLTSKGITAADWAAANRIELLMITFAGGTPTTVNQISQAGSGRNPANGVCQPGGACRNSFIATNLTDLVNALNDAINTSTATGTFSDQQSVTETVFEYVGVATPPKDPLDPDTRYAVNVPILLQSTFDLPGWNGHLNAFRRSDNGTPADPTDDVTVPLWDAGQKLYSRVSDVTNGMGPAPASPCTGGAGAGCYLFEDLYGNATNTNPLNVFGTTAKIKRRIFTTSQNGVNPFYNPSNLLSASSSLGWVRMPLWPPTTGATDGLYVAPTVTGTGATPVRGALDDAMGLGALTTVAQVQALVPGACQGAVPANIHPDCTSATAGVPLARAKREAREIILAYIAGARVQTINGNPVRTGTTGPAAGRQQLLYEVRPWIMVESSLTAPGVVTPPLLAGPKSSELGFEEYKLYRDGIRSATGAPVAGVPNGLGLRNPDRVDVANPSIKSAAAADLNLKPSMSVVYHATNQGLHALRAGPCPVAQSGSGLFGTTLPCDGETGGEELWAFVPFDQLSKLPALTKIQTRTNKQYLLASPVRFSDVFVPGGASFGGASFTGVWRTILYFGRGRGGNSYTALDITVPGQFTRHSLQTEAPIVVWSRGNPDTNNGKAFGLGGVLVNTLADYSAYLKMGETWSLPSLGYVTAADYTTPRTGVNGTNFVLFTGSGYSDVATQGKTFYVLDALTGDVVRSFDIPDGTPAPPPVAVPPAPQDPPLTNFLVAPPVVYAEDISGNSPSGYRFIGNPITAKAKAVYFGDLHGRIWRYNATTPAAAPTAFFTNNNITNGNQPFATAVSVLQNRPDTSVPGDVLVYAESGFDRRVTPQAAKPFKSYAWQDVNGTRVDVFTRDFEANYRGTVQPASAFAGATLPPSPVVFYAGVKFTGACVSTFDSILIALKGVTTTPGIPVPAFDLKATGDDAFIELTGQKINAIRVSGEGNLVVDTGLNAQNTPPPPGVAVPTETTSTSSSLVTIGLVPGTQAYKDLAATTVPFRVGSSVCRTQ